MTIEIIRAPITRAHLSSLAEAQFGDMVKAVVDVERRVMAIGGELHSDEEAALIDDGSAQARIFGGSTCSRPSQEMGGSNSTR